MSPPQSSNENNHHHHHRRNGYWQETYNSNWDHNAPQYQSKYGLIKMPAPQNWSTDARYQVMDRGQQILDEQGNSYELDSVYHQNMTGNKYQNFGSQGFYEDSQPKYTESTQTPSNKGQDFNGSDNECCLVDKDDFQQQKNNNDKFERKYNIEKKKYRTAKNELDKAKMKIQMLVKKIANLEKEITKLSRA